MNHLYSCTALVLLVLLTGATSLVGQTLSGKVTNNDNTPLVGATIAILDSEGKGTTTDQEGRYQLSLPASGTYLVTASYVGYQADTLRISTEDSQKPLKINFKLFPAFSNLLVEVTDSYLATERRLEMATERLSIEDIKQIPLILGEADILRSLQFLPGVQTGAEGQTGLHVRGGSPDQNLILLDGVPIYNPNHVFGFISAFNPEAVEGVVFRRGGFPARYGGRLSSVVDVKMRSGDRQRTQKRISLGPLLAKASLDGPLGAKTTYLVSARRSLYDLLLSPARARRDENNNPQNNRETRYAFGFTDANIKITHEPDDRNRISLTGYWGRDRYDRLVNNSAGGFSTRVEEIQNWGNLIGGVDYRRTWSDRLTQNVKVGYTGYQYEVGDSEEAERSSERLISKLFYRSGVTELSARTDLIARLRPGLTLRGGVGAINRTFRTGDYEIILQDNRAGAEIDRDTTIGRPTLTSLETFGYVEGIAKLGGGLSINAGLHLAGLNGGDWRLQPRLSVRQNFGESTSFKLGFAAMRQYLHLIVSGSLGLPNDVWVPSTDALPPQDSWQVSLGMERQLSPGWKLELDAYYKSLSSTANYLPGRGVISLAPWESLLTTGTGEAYGVETRLARTEGRLSGWLAYTMNWSWRTFEELNLGRSFPYRYDRRHDLRLVTNYALRPDKILLSANFVYASGNPVTVSNSLVNVGIPFLPGATGGTVEFQSFTAVNNYRLAPTHRLDFGITFRKRKGHRLREIALGVYNAYARQNPYYVNLRLDPNPPSGNRWRGELVQVNLLRAIPYLTYSIHW